MAIEVEVPDVGIVEFPDDFAPEQIKSVLAKKYSKQAAVPVPMIQPGGNIPGLEQYTNGAIPLKPYSEFTSKDILASPPAIRERALSGGAGLSIPAQPVREARALEKVAPYLNQTDELSKQRIGKVLESSLQEPLPVPSIGQDIVKAGTQGALNDVLAKLGVDKQTFADASDTINAWQAGVNAGIQGKNPLEAYQEVAGQPRRNPNKVEEILAGGHQAVMEAMNFFTSPLGVATLGTGSLPAGAQRAVAGAFTAQMAASVPDQVNALIAAVKSGDWEAGSKAAVGLGLTGVFIKQGGEAALGKTKPTAERTQDVIQQEAQETPGVLETTKPGVSQEVASSGKSLAQLQELKDQGLLVGKLKREYDAKIAESARVNKEAGDKLKADIEVANKPAITNEMVESGKVKPPSVNEILAMSPQELKGAKQWLGDASIVKMAKEVTPEILAKLKAERDRLDIEMRAAQENLTPLQPKPGEPISPEYTAQESLTFDAQLKRQTLNEIISQHESERSVENLPKAEQEKLNQGEGRKYATESKLTEADIPRLEELKKKHDAAFKASGYTDSSAQALAEFYYGARSVILNNRETKASTTKQGAAQPERLPEKPVAPVAGERPVSKSSERITSAAARSPDGTIYTGKWHPAAYEHYMKEKGVTKQQVIQELESGKLEDGFVTSDGKFVNRDEAAKIASKANQFKPDKEGDIAFAGGLKGMEAGAGIIRSSKPQESAVETQGAIATSTPLTPSATTTTLTPKSQRQIITDLAKGLDLPIRFGRLTTSKFAGYFKPRANLIGSKRAVDVPTVSHEVGHKLDDTLKLSADNSIASELDVLGDPATPGSGSSWTPSKTKKYKMGEGVAEFVRHWLTDPAKALKDAPNTHKAFEAALDANKDFGDVMRQAQEDIRTWRESEPQARLRSHISTDNPNKTRYTLSQLTRDVVDDLHILRLAVIDANKSGTLPPSKDPYLAARNLRGSYGMAETFIRNGVADFNTKEVKLGTSLQDALKPVAGRLSDFRDWIVSKRAQELRRQGKETGLVASDVDAVVSKFDKDPVFQKAFDDLKAWNDAALQYAVDSGLITPESAAAMRKMNLDYVPFSRLFEVGAGEAPSQQGMGIGTGLNVGKPGSFKRLSGSTREIVDPIETMIKNAYTIITASEKAAINRSVAEMASLPDMGKWVEKVASPKEGIRFDLERVKKQLEDAGADLTNVPDDLILSFFRQSGRAPFGENIIRVIRNGEPEFYRLNRDLHDTFQALDLEDSGKLVRILSAPAQLLRAGVVLEPSFNVANALRDTFSAAVINKYGALPFETTLKGVAAMIKNPQAVAEWAAAGGKNSVEANFFDRTKMQKFLTEKISKDLTPAERALIVTKSPLTALRWLTSKAEEATRIGEYQIAYKKLTESGMPEGEARRLAAFEARDRQDFAKGGAKTKIIRHMSAFWNASLQANVKLAQAFKERPGRTILQGLAFVTIPKLLEQAVNWDDEDYWKRQQWERDMFFMIPIGKDDNGHTRFLRIPTPFEVGIIFGTFPGRILQWMRTNKPESVAGFPQMMLKQSVPNPIPQTMQVAFEDFLSGEKGWDIWRGRTIVPESLADLPADLQWTDQTSGLAKEVGKRMGFSPMKVDHIIERTTGGMGKLLTGRQVPGQRFVAAPLAVSNQPINEFYETLDKLREEHARVKATKRGLEPKGLQQFEATARELSELRDKARKSKSEAQKAMIQEQIFQKAKKQMDRYRT